MELHNGGALGLGQVEMCQAFQTLRCNNVGMACSLVSISILLFGFPLNGPSKELRLLYMSVEKCVNKIFLLFSKSESAEVSPN